MSEQDTASIVSTITVKFVDGSCIELASVERFKAIKDALRIAALTNNNLNEQNRLMGIEISELQKKLHDLDKENHHLVMKMSETEFVVPEEININFPSKLP